MGSPVEPTPESIRAAEPADAPRLKDVARAAYVGYVERVRREPASMRADHVIESTEVWAAMAENRRLHAWLGYEETGYAVERGYRRVLMRKTLNG